MSDDVEGASPAEVLARRGRFGLALRPSDCSEQLAALADAMHATADGMSWVAQFAEDVDRGMRDKLKYHSAHLHQAARWAERLSNSIQAP